MYYACCRAGVPTFTFTEALSGIGRVVGGIVGTYGALHGIIGVIILVVLYKRHSKNLKAWRKKKSHTPETGTVTASVLPSFGCPWCHQCQ